MVDFANRPKSFSLGRLLATPGALKALEQSGEEALPYLLRHARGDWGVVCDEDKRLNDEALKDGERLVSAYELKDGTKIWVITEADRSATTVLMPDEY